MKTFIVEETAEVTTQYRVIAATASEAIQAAQNIAVEDGEQIRYAATEFEVWTPEELERNGMPVLQESV